MRLFLSLLTQTLLQGREKNPLGRVSPDIRAPQVLCVLRQTLERLDDLWKIEKVPLLRYSDAIGRFVHTRPEDERVVRGALIRRPDISGSLIIWLFLDCHNKPLYDRNGKLYGSKLLANELDEELIECLGDSGILLVG